MSRHRWFALGTLIALLAVVGLMQRGISPLAAEQEKGPPSKAKVYVYPLKVTPKDKLSFGVPQMEMPVAIKRESTLVYVDLNPTAKFSHPTMCILISNEGAEMIKGDWWLVLNGKALFRDEKDFKVNFPIELSGK